MLIGSTLLPGLVKMWCQLGKTCKGNGKRPFRIRVGGYLAPKSIVRWS
jgi:hypothetical protein